MCCIGSGQLFSGAQIVVEVLFVIQVIRFHIGRTKVSTRNTYLETQYTLILANNAAAKSDMLQKRRPRNEHVTQAPSIQIVAASESCERHCARTRNKFGCVLGGTPAIGAFVSEPTDSQLSSAGCRCLNAELLCDRNAHCHNGSDEWPVTCANWNASMTCRSSNFTCATGLAVQPQLGRRPFCIPKKARCDAHADCEDWSDEVNCPHLPPPPPLRLVRYGTVQSTRAL